MESYLNEGIKLLSPKTIIARLGAWTKNTSRGTNCHAAIYQDKIGDPFRIWMHTHYYDENNKAAQFSKIDLLEHLAHELAHTESWTHTPKHKRLEAKIKIKFMHMLQSDGYVSEEDELK
jgi:hypothetical protein